LKKYKILIVDDERPLAEMMRLNFPEDKFEAATCHTGKDALKEADARHPDLILLDVMMGDMDGWEVLAKLKANPKTAGIPVIMCTARDSSRDINKSFERGAQAYIMKPIQFPKLLAKISALLDTEELLSD